MPSTRTVLIAALFALGGAVTGCTDTTSSSAVSPIGASLEMQASAFEVEVEDLTYRIGPDANLAAYLTDINDLGHLVGVGSDGQTFFWTPDLGVVDLGVGYGSEARALNNQDEVVGAFGFGQRPGEGAFRWTPDAGLRMLPGLESSLYSEASDINDGGDVAGSIIGNRGSEAVLWEPGGTVVRLGEIRPGCGCGANPKGINENGAVAGIGFDIPPSLGLTVARGFVWDRAAGMTSLSTLGYEGPFTESEAYGINASGHIVGESDGAAFLWTPSTGMEDLHVSDRGASARAINDAGFIVGVANFPDIDGDRGYVRLPDGAVLVLPPIGLGGVGGEGAPFSHAVAINNRNEIVGSSTTETGAVHQTLWRLVPTSVNRAPVAIPGGPYVGSEGTAVLFDGSGSSDPDGEPLVFAWDFGDGSTSHSATSAHAYGGSGTYAVTLSVTDPGGLSATAATTAIIANVAPTVGVIVGASILQGEAFMSAGSFADPGTETWTGTVDYGDGSGVVALPLVGKSFSLSHVYAVTGTFVVTVTISDEDGGIGAAHAAVVVQTAQQGTETLASTVDGLVQTGALSSGNGTALSAKLAAAIAQLDRGNTTAAVNQLEAFVQQVTDLVSSGRLSATDGQNLVEAANRIIRAVQTQ